MTMIPAHLTPEQLDEQAREARQRSQDSFDRCDTDGFLSQWASDISAELYEREAQIRRDGGQAEFWGLFSLATGERLPAKIIQGRFGSCWLNQRTHQFFPHLPVRKSTLAKRGVEERREMAAARAVISGSGKGLSGCANARVITIRTDGGYPGARPE
jgi:hypothetical protein